jgi:hypothetical protein
VAKVSYLKQAKFRPKPVTANMNYVPCPCDGTRVSVPGWLLDKIADQKLTGGFNVRRSNQCPNCFEVRSANGTCSCR